VGLAGLGCPRLRWLGAASEPASAGPPEIPHGSRPVAGEETGPGVSGSLTRRA